MTNPQSIVVVMVDGSETEDGRWIGYKRKLQWTASISRRTLGAYDYLIPKVFGPRDGVSIT